MPSSAPPCPQAARAPGVMPLPPPTLLNIVEDLPQLPRPAEQAAALPNALVDQAVTWPYHLPSFNGVDCLWWGMLARSMYAAEDSWLRRVATWASPVLRLQFTDRSQPARQGFGLVELGDSVLVVIPGTSSEAEALSYFLTHSLRLLYRNPDFFWQINATWATRGQQVLTAYNAFTAGRPHKPVIFIGHSSGGAYGAYCVYSAFSDPFQPNTLATYGAPIWGTDSLAAFYVSRDKQPKTLDFGAPNDPVLTVPPAWALVDYLGVQYAASTRTSYARVNPLLMLQANGPPDGGIPSPPLAIATAAFRSVLGGGGLGAAHSTANYTALADAWAANDPSIDADGLRPAYTALKAILTDMNSAGLY